MSQFDQEIVQDFLTESGELLDQLDQDLVLLETTPKDPELLNRVFRALHTIKGSASFLALTNLVNIAHAAEGALNAARSGVVVLNKAAMDLILAGVDILKKQFENLRAGQDLVKADDRLVAELTQIAEGRLPTGAVSDTPAAAPAATSASASIPATIKAVDLPVEQETTAEDPIDQHSRAIERVQLKLDESKASLIEFLVVDVRETLAQAEAAAHGLSTVDTLPSSAGKLVELAESVVKNAVFFEFEHMQRLASALMKVGTEAPELDSSLWPQLLPRIDAILQLLREQADGLSASQILKHPIDGLCDSVAHLLEDGHLSQDRQLSPSATAADVLRIDQVIGAPKAPATSAATPAPIPAAASAPVVVERVGETPTHPSSATPAAANQPASEHKNPEHGAGAIATDQTIRVEVGRLEALLNLVGELVLQKNRLSAIARNAISASLGSADFQENFTTATGNLDRVTSDIQVAVMRTRMQPLDKLFGKYPRLIRDLARKTGKDMRLVIEGGDTEVDKSVIEELGDPLIHILRNSADHGIETPEERAKTSKESTASITLRASHEGSFVQVSITDDGRGLSRKKIGGKAVERGLVTEQALQQMSDADVFAFIFAAGFSTAEVVTDLSGRGVGMDVVRTNIEKIKGSIELDSVEGKGTTIRIKIPLTVAILTAMMVRIGAETYAVPLSSIVEIVKPEPAQLSSIQNAPVMRLRDAVLPLLSGGDLFGLPKEKMQEEPFAVILAQGDKRVGLLVTRLIGQQEVVIKPLDEMVDRSGPVSGATVRDDGGVSLIVDIAQMIRIAEERTARSSSKSADSNINVKESSRSSSLRQIPQAA